MEGTRKMGIVELRPVLGDRVDAAYYSGETTVITKNDRPRAAIVPCALLAELDAYRARFGPLPTD